jgi:hypothetical protein
MRLRWLAVSLALVGVVIVGAAVSLHMAQGGQEGGDAGRVTHFSYDAGPDTFAPLVETADAIVVASPAGNEVVLASFEDGIQVVGQPFAVVASFKGSFVPGSAIMVLRTALGTPWVPPSGTLPGEAPFVRERYILGIRQSATYPAWVVVGGPSGRIGFADDGTAVVEEEGIAVQEELAGMTLDEVTSLVQQILLASGND